MIPETITRFFLMPATGLAPNIYIKQGLLNSYSGYWEFPQTMVEDQSSITEHLIFNLYRYKDVDVFREFLEYLYEFDPTICYDFPVENFDDLHITEHALPEKFNQDYLKVKCGQYSRTSREFQALFPKKITTTYQGIKVSDYSFQYQIFNKMDKIKNFWEDEFAIRFDEEDEIWEGFDTKKEYLSKDSLIKIANK